MNRNCKGRCDVVRAAGGTARVVIFLVVSVFIQDASFGQSQPHLDSVRTKRVIVGAYTGFALPTWYNPQPFNLLGVSIGIKPTTYLLTSLEAHTAGTSAAIFDTFPNAVKIADYSVGVTAMWVGVEHLLASVTLGYERRNYALSLPLEQPNEKYLESRDRFQLGFGLGLRSSRLDPGLSLLLEVRHYPALTHALFPGSAIEERGRTELRGGILFDLPR